MAAEEEREEPEQVEHKSDHRAEIVAGSEPTDQPLARGLLFAAVVLAPVGPIATVALFTAVGFADGLTFVVAPTLLSRESPTGRGMTMALNGTAHSFGTALGGALGGLGLALGGYAYLGLLSIAFGTAAALLASWSGRSSP
jgi:predicted MFS family arabinose efflux permease